MNSASGRALRLFNNWKNLPTRNLRDDLLGKAANELERRLGLLVFKRLKAVNDPLKEQMVRGELIQKQVCKDIITKTMSSQKRMFLHWVQAVRDFRAIRIFKLTNKFFDGLNDTVRNNNKLLLTQGLSDQKKIDVLQRIFNTQRTRLQDGLNLWRKYIQVTKMESNWLNERKARMIESAN